MLADSFYENVDRDGRNAVLHCVPRPADTMLVACLFARWTDPEGRRFVAVVRRGHRRSAGRRSSELQDILSDRNARYYEHEVRAA